MPNRWRVLLVVLAGAAFGTAGCGEQPDTIRTYKVPKPADVPPDDVPQYRIVGAMFPADNPAWFFKLAGAAEQIEPQAAAFEKMLASVRFPNGLRNLPVWDMPAGWSSGGERPEKMARDTIRLGPDSPLEATLTQAGGDVFQNVERWAGQVGLKPFTEAEMAKHTRAFEAGNVKGLWVDVRGSKNPAAARPPFMGGR